MEPLISRQHVLARNVPASLRRFHRIASTVVASERPATKHRGPGSNRTFTHQNRDRGAGNPRRPASRCRPFRHNARSPQVRPLRSPHNRRIYAAFLRSRELGEHLPARPVRSALYPIPVRRLAVSLPASFSRFLAVPAFRFARSPCDRVVQKTFPSMFSFMPGPQQKWELGLSPNSHF
jgi:hypothetical protein